MNCDDFMLLVANPRHDEAALDDHLSACPSCRELGSHLEIDDLDDDALDAEPTTGPDEMLGREIGAYRISRLLGTGGMGRVYLAVHPEIGSRVAIKVFSRDWSQNPALVNRFFAEARAANVIAHENIVNVLDVGRLDDGRPYLVMEHLPGQPLSALIGSPDLTDERARSLMLDVLGALAAAHGHEIIHRDLKPDNIFVSPEWRATLLDFGIAKLRPDDAADAVPTKTGTVLGTPHYMSPEQARGNPVDKRTDVYAIGVILYECFLGRRPFQGTSLFTLLEQHVHRAPIAPRNLRPELGADLESVILSALEKSRADRFDSIEQMRAALAACEVDASAGAFSIGSDVWERELAGALGGNTAATVVARRQPRLEPSPGTRRWMVGGATLFVLGLGLAWLASRRPPASERAGVVALDGGLGLDAALGDAAASMPSALDVPRDAGPARDSAPDSRPRRPPRPRGVAPLSLLDRARELAAEQADDVVLARVRLGGVSASGRALLSQGALVGFDFLSPRLAERARGEKGRCLIRVTFTAAKPRVERLSTRCDPLRTLPAIRCSVATMLQRGRSRSALPAAGDVTTATLQMTGSRTRSTAYWKIEIDARTYKLPICP